MVGLCDEHVSVDCKGNDVRFGLEFAGRALKRKREIRFARQYGLDGGSALPLEKDESHRVFVQKGAHGGEQVILDSRRIGGDPHDGAASRLKGGQRRLHSGARREYFFGERFQGVACGREGQAARFANEKGGADFGFELLSRWLNAAVERPDSTAAAAMLSVRASARNMRRSVRS